MFLSSQNCRIAAAWLLLTAPFLNMPLAFLRLTGNPVPLYGLVRMVDFPVLSLLAAGMILLFPEQLKVLFRNKNLRWLFAAAGIFILNIFLRFFVSAQNFTDTLSALFWIIYPLAAAALAPELRKIMPCFAGIAAILLIYSGIVSEKFTGLAGNWNWLQGIVVALLPALALWGKKKLDTAPGATLVTDTGHRKNRAVILLIIFFTGMGIFFPAGFSRSALAAVAGAGIFLFLRNRITNRIFFRIVLIGTAAAVIGFFAGLCLLDLAETRFIIWQGAFDLFLDKIASCGTGHGHFSEFIRQYLGESYFFSAFPSVHIDHAHNDLLNISCEHGIAGLFFYLTAVITILLRREKTPNGIFIQWIFLILLICGFFDQHNFMVLCGSFTAISAGILIAPRHRFTVKKFTGQIFCRIAGIILILCAIHFAIVNYQTTGFIRHGDLLLMQGNIDGARSKYIDSLRQKPTCHALYQLAEIQLGKGDPHTASDMIDRMDQELGIANYRHTPRMRSVASAQAGDLITAAAAMAQELRNAPYSVINARYQRIILRQIKASPETISAADQNFFTLCKMRNISPETAAKYPVHLDDAPFPQTAEAPAASPSVIREIGSALILLLALFGLGKMVLLIFNIKGDMAALPLGMIISGMTALIFVPDILKYAMIVLALPGAYFLLPILKKHWKISLIFTLLLLPLLASALLPPSAWDEQVYQVALLKKYLANDSVMPLIDNPYSAYPSLGQLWLLSGFAAGGSNVPILCVWLITGIMAAQFFHFGKEKSGVFPAVTLLAAIFLSPLTWNIIRSFYVETFIALFALTGAWLLLKDECRKSHILLAGIMAGAATAVKLPGASVSLALFILLILDRGIRKYWWIFIIGAFFAALPFFLRVWIACGNPFYPYLSALTGASESAVMVEIFHRTLGGNYGVNPVAGIFFNWILCAYDGMNYDGIVTGFQFSLAVFIIFWAAIRNWKENRFLPIFAAALTAAWIFWNLTAQQTRFLYPLLWLLAMALLYAVNQFPHRPRMILCVLLIAAAVPSAVIHFSEGKHFLLAWKNVCEARKNPAHFAAWINKEPLYAELAEQLKPLAKYKIASLWERRTLYLPDNVTIIMPGFQEKLFPVPQSAEALYHELKNFDFLIVRPPATDVDKAIEFIPEAVKLNGFLLELLKNGKLAIHSRTADGQISILRIVPETAPISVRPNN